MTRRTGPPLKKLAEQVKESSKKKPEQRRKDPGATIPTGLTTMNLALAENVINGFRKGSIVNIVGDTHTGKTVLLLNCFAACAHDRLLRDYKFIHDEPERAMSFDVPYLFGKKTARRISSPHANGKSSRTVEEYLYGLLELLEKEEPFISALDSLDALDSDADIEHVEKSRKAWKKGKASPGSYGMGKAKGMSNLFRHLVEKIEESESLLIIVSQTRDNINPNSFKEKTRSGGKALDFYAHIIMWLAHKGSIKVTRRGKQLSIGNSTRVSITKNKYTGKSRQLFFDTFYDYGVDDIGAMVSWLDTFQVWVSVKNELGLKKVPTKDMTATQRLKIAKQIEELDLDDKLRYLLKDEWMELEESLRLDRKRRF